MTTAPKKPNYSYPRPEIQAAMQDPAHLAWFKEQCVMLFGEDIPPEDWPHIRVSSTEAGAYSSDYKVAFKVSKSTYYGTTTFALRKDETLNEALLKETIVDAIEEKRASRKRDATRRANREAMSARGIEGNHRGASVSPSEYVEGTVTVSASRNGMQMKREGIAIHQIDSLISQFETFCEVLDSTFGKGATSA